MPKFKNVVAIRWRDKKGIKHKKIYQNLQDADRARKWLLANGVDDIDIAVVVEELQEGENNETNS